MKKTRLLGVLLLLIITTFSSPYIQASYIELNSGSYWGSSPSGGGEGTGRGMSFQANSTFSISSIGIFGDLLNESFDVVIYSSTNGHQANSILSSSSAIVGGTGNGWNDISINYIFTENEYYVINWRASDGGSSNWVDTNLDYYNDSFLTVTVGPVTLIDGVEGFDATSFTNPLHPNLRINTSTIPTPAAVWLFGSGLLGLVGIARRKKSAYTINNISTKRPRIAGSFCISCMSSFGRNRKFPERQLCSRIGRSHTNPAFIFSAENHIH